MSPAEGTPDVGDHVLRTPEDVGRGEPQHRPPRGHEPVLPPQVVDEDGALPVDVAVERLVGRGLGAALVQLPAVLVVAGIAALLVGVAPRLSALAWAVVVWALLAGLFGPLLSLPEWALRLSPFGWVPRVPAEALDVVPLAGLALLAVALVTLAMITFRRRDVPA
jgi:hypothetical protein